MSSNSPYYMSPIDGHDHFTRQGRQGCAVCRLEAERDRLGEQVRLLEDDLANVAFVLASALPPDGDRTVKAEDAYEMLNALVAERARLQAAVEAGHKMMGTMRGHAGPADEDAWLAFELRLADLANAEEGT